MTRLPRHVVALCALLMALAAAPALAQALHTIALSPGDTLIVNCSTSLTGVPVGDQSETLNCALVATP